MNGTTRPTALLRISRTIDGITGEVVDINPFSAKVQELETAKGTYGFTGKIIQIPNSRYFTYPIENLSYLKNYKSHQFDVAFQCDMLDPVPLLKKLGDIVATHTKEFQDEAAQVCKRTKRISHILLPDPAPQITFSARDFNNMRFTIRAYHLNEGHAALLTLELLNRFRLPPQDWREGEPRPDLGEVRERCVFTTHTPVEAGHDRFDYELVERLLPGAVLTDDVLLASRPRQDHHDDLDRSPVQVRS